VKIVILGGGVAGISSAIALKQAGYNVSVYERYESSSNLGTGIVLWPNAVYVLEQLGVLNQISNVSGNPTSMRRISSANEDLGAIDIELINRNMGYPSLSILRRDFQTILLAKLASLGAPVHYDHTVTDIQSDDNNQAQVHFQNGTHISADVVIGADGRMASHARRYVNNDNTPVYQGFINWIGVFESAEESFQECAVEDYWGIGERFGIVPVTKHKAYWAGGIACANVGRRNPVEYKSELRSIFSRWPQVVQKMIEHTPGERINKIFVHDHNPIQTWHKHNLLVIGDAAHAPLPTSGQGACQALEDALHLAQCLQENPGELQLAFTRFMEKRLEKTTNIIMAARNFARSLFNNDKDYCMVRNENSKKTDYSRMAAAMSHGWAQGLPLNT